MLKREFKVNLKSFIIWTSIIILMFIMVFSIYPSIVQDEAMLDEMISTMPEGLLSIFNMDVVSINKVSGWLATEGYVMIMLLGSCYAAIIGSNIIIKEEDDKTIEFLYSKPVSRFKIYISKVTVGSVYIILFNLFVSITNLLGLLISNDFNFKNWILLSILPVFLHLFIYFLSLLISNLFNKTRKSMSICLGMVFILYFINILSTISDNVSFLKYFTPFTYVDSSNVLKSGSINIGYLLLCCSLIIIFSVIAYMKYRKKEF